MNNTNKPTKAEVERAIKLLQNVVKHDNLLSISIQNDNTVLYHHLKDCVIAYSSKTIIEALKQEGFDFAEESEAEKLAKEFTQEDLSNALSVMFENRKLEKRIAELEAELAPFKNSLAYTHDGEFNKIERKPNPVKKCTCKNRVCSSNCVR